MTEHEQERHARPRVRFPTGRRRAPGRTASTGPAPVGPHDGHGRARRRARSSAAPRRARCSARHDHLQEHGDHGAYGHDASRVRSRRRRPSPPSATSIASFPSHRRPSTPRALITDEHLLQGAAPCSLGDTTMRRVASPGDAVHLARRVPMSEAARVAAAQARRDHDRRRPPPTSAVDGLPGTAGRPSEPRTTPSARLRLDDRARRRFWDR